MTNQYTTPWTPDRVAELGRLVAEGLWTAEIARRMGLRPNQVAGRLRSKQQRGVRRCSSPWDDPGRIDLVDRLLAQGLTTAAVARRVNVTKNAVVGKVSRTPRLRSTMRGRDTKSQLAASYPTLNWNYPPHGGCHWPEGDPGDLDFHFCGAPVATPGRPYCEEHERRAYNPKPTKTDA
jgi:GcrA cell cycle regulator